MTVKKVELPMRGTQVRGTVYEMVALATYLRDSLDCGLMDDAGYTRKQKAFVKRVITDIQDCVKRDMKEMELP